MIRSGPEARRIITLAGPLILGNMGGVAIQLTDALMIAQLGTTQFAAVGLAGHLGAVIFLFCSGFAHALGVSVAQRRGADPSDFANLRGWIWDGLWLVQLVAIPLSLLLIAGEAFFVLTGQTADVSRMAGRYLSTFLFAIPFMVLCVALGGVATALERPVVFMWASIATILFNLVGNYVLIFGYLGAPRMEEAGAGISSIVSSGAQAVLLFALFRIDRRLRVLELFQWPTWPRRSTMTGLLAAGFPVGLMLLVEVGFFSATAFLAGQWGTEALAAHQVAIQIVTIALMISLGVGQATAVCVGSAYGSGDWRSAFRAGLVAAALIVLTMALLGIAIFSMRKHILALFLIEQGMTFALGMNFLAITSFFLIADGLQTVMAGALRGLNKAGTALVLNILSYWTVGTIVIVLCALFTTLAASGIWVGMASALTFLAIMLMLAFFRMGWTRLS